jgi:transcriptional regulator GlxA family with amidase domain
MKRRDFQLILEIRAYLDAHLYQAHSIEGLCRQFNTNREKIQSGFHELVDSTVHAYIVRQRIDRAAQRLLTTDDSIKAISMESGYKKQRSFNKTFKAIYHATPATYRRLHQRPEAATSQAGQR